MPRVFRADADFDGVALELHILLAKSERAALRDQQLLLHQIEPGDQLGHAMLDLQPRVHLHEIEPLVGVQQKLERAHAGVANGAAGHAGDLTHLGAQCRIHGGRGRFFDQLLKAALRRAIALAQMQAGALFVAQHLHLDVATAFDGTLDDDLVRAKGAGRFRLRLPEHFGQLSGLAHHAHAATATTRGGFQNHRKADARGRGLNLLHRGAALLAGHRGHAGGLHGLLGLGLVAHECNDPCSGANKREARIGNRLRELGIFGKKTVAGVNGLRTRAAAGVDDGRDVAVALVGRGGADVYGQMGRTHMRALRVGVGIDGDSAKAHAPRGTDHAQRDFSAVGNEQGVKAHGLSPSCAGVRPRAWAECPCACR